MEYVKTLKISLDGKNQGTGVGGFISWSRLEEELKQSRTIKPYERIVHISVDGRGITFIVERDE